MMQRGVAVRSRVASWFAARFVARNMIGVGTNEDEGARHSSGKVILASRILCASVDPSSPASCLWTPRVEEALDALGLAAQDLAPILGPSRLAPPRPWVLPLFMWARQRPSMRGNLLFYSSFLGVLAASCSPVAVWRLLEDMSSDGFFVKPHLFSVLTRHYGASGAADEAWRTMLRARRDFACPLDSHAYATLAHTFAENGRLDEALFMFACLRSKPPPHPPPSVVMYNVLLYALLRKQRLMEAQSLIRDMHLVQILPSPATFSIVLNSLLDSNRIDLALSTFVHLKQSGVTPPIRIYHTLVKTLIKLGRLNAIPDLIDEIIAKSVTLDICSCNVFLHGLTELKQLDQALLLFRHLKSSGLSLTEYTYTTLVDGLLKACRWEEASLLLQEMESKSHVRSPPPYCAFLNAYCKAGQLDKAIAMVKTMEGKGIELSTAVFNVLIKALQSEGRQNEASLLMGFMRKKGIDLNAVTHNTILSNLCKAGKLGEASSYFNALLEKEGCGVNVRSYNILINALSKCGEMGEAVKLVDSMRKTGYEPDIVTKTILLDGLCRAGDLDKALTLFSELDCPPNEATYSILVKGLSERGRLEEARGLFQEMVEKGFSPKVTICSVLMNGYLNGRSLDKAYLLIIFMVSHKCIPHHDLVTMLINSLLEKGQCDVVLDITRAFHAGGYTFASETWQKMGKALSMQTSVAMKV